LTSLAEAIAEVRASIERYEHSETLAAEAERLRKDFRAFIRASWPVVEPTTKYTPGWHIDAIAEKLAECGEGRIQRLVINIPPRHMKSLAVSVFWPVWLWTTHPSMRFLTASYGDDLATRDALKSRRLIQSGWFRARFAGSFSLTGDQNQKTRYENDHTGYRIATSVGGAATGEGGDVVIIDDPHKANEVLSDVLRKKVLDWHDEVISTRFNDPSTGIEILIMQRLHELDLTGHLLARGGWEHLCLPAEYVRKHPFVWPDDPRKKEGQLLWPDRFGAKEMARLKVDMGSQYVIAGQLQQLPAPREGALLKRADWRYYDSKLSFYAEREVFGPEQVTELASRVGPFDSLVHSWDTSVKDREHSDFVSGQVWATRGAHRFLLRLYHARAGLNATTEAMLELALWAAPLWPNVPHYVVIENSANGPDAAAAIRSRVQGVILANAKGSKEVRAEAAEPALVGHNCFLPGEATDDGSNYSPRTPTLVQAFIEELAVFNLGAHDDQVDAWSSMINWTRNRGGATMSVPTGQATPPRFRDERATALRPALR
jgi:hypothetical protein